MKYYAQHFKNEDWEDCYKVYNEETKPSWVNGIFLMKEWTRGFQQKIKAGIKEKGYFVFAI